MSGKVFINYRRQDSAAYAGRLYDLLSNTVGPENIFFDVDRIPMGDSLYGVIERAVAEADVFLVIIGADWVSPELERPDDFVRVEIETALQLGKYVIPVLVGGARFPSPSQLPPSIAPLATRNAASLTHERFQADVRSLSQVIERVLSDRSAPARARRSVQLPESAAHSAWDAIKDSSNSDDLRDYLARFPQAPQANAARAKIEGLLWGEVLLAPTTVSVLAYLAEYPEGVHKVDARAWLGARLESARAELGDIEVRKSALDREIRLIVGPEESFRNDVFVSYAKSEPEITRAIVKALEAEGYKVWWDTNLVSGDEFSDVIRRELVGSRAVVVIWTPTSVKSKWVKAEATMADFDDKLVPVRPRDLDPREIPLPFNVHHCEAVEDHAALIKAIKKKGVFPGGISKPSLVASKARVEPVKSSKRTWWQRIVGA